MAAKPGGWAYDLEQLLRGRWKIGQQFSLAEVYEFRSDLARTRPDINKKNLDVRIRDSLQLLRHRGTIESVGKGQYRLLETETART